MPTKSESRFASELRKLGFEQLTPEQEAYFTRRVERRLEQRGVPEHINQLSRNQRRQFNKWLKKPSFLIIVGDQNTTTVATDDTGKRWRATKAVELRPLGFLNIAPAAVLGASFEPLPPEKHLH